MSHKMFYLKAAFIWLSTCHLRRAKHFTFEQHSYRYFTHGYNVTWLHERSVEIPVIREIFRQHQGARILEVGNVLAHYDKTLQHPVVDKYEKRQQKNLYTEDAETFSHGAPYDLIVSLSTFEHIGWDELPRDPGKISRTIEHLRSLLTPDGELIFTAPVGYSQSLDSLIDSGEGIVTKKFLKRINKQNEWKEIDWDEAKDAKFHEPFPFANALAIVRASSTNQLTS